MGIPDLILLKPGRLPPEEFEIMKTHTTIGARTLEEVRQAYSKNNFILTEGGDRSQPTHFNPAILAAFLGLAGEFDAIYSRFCG